MGRLKKEDKDNVQKHIDDTKHLLGNVQSQNGANLQDLISALAKSVEGDDPSGEFTQYVPIHTLEKIKEKLGSKIVVESEDGKKTVQPLYAEEEKVKIIFGLLSERGINLLDYLEKTLQETGYNGKVVFAINETMSKTAEVLRDVAEIQYRKAKLENERVHLEIQKYKADLKKREIEIKEKSAGGLGNGTNIIAVGSTNELLKLMNGKKDISEVEVQATVEEREDGEREE